MQTGEGTIQERIRTGSQLVLVRKGQERYAVPADEVVEYLPAGETWQFPALLKHVAGLGVYRDRALSVVSLEAFEENACAVVGAGSKWLVLHGQSKDVILTVDSVLGLGTVEASGRRDRQRARRSCVRSNNGGRRSVLGRRCRKPSGLMQRIACKDLRPTREMPPATREKSSTTSCSKLTHA